MAVTDRGIVKGGEGGVHSETDDADARVVTFCQVSYDKICDLYDIYGVDDDEPLVSYTGERAIPLDQSIGEILLNHPGIQVITSVARDFGIDELYIHGGFCESVFIGTKIPCVSCAGESLVGVQVIDEVGAQVSDEPEMGPQMVYTELMRDIDIAILLPPTVSSRDFFEAVDERGQTVSNWNYKEKKPAVGVAPGKPHTDGLAGYEQISGDRGEITWVPKLDVHFVGVDENLSLDEKHEAISRNLGYILPAHSQMALELSLVDREVHLIDDSGRFFHGIFLVVPDESSNQFRRLRDMSRQVVAGETVEVDWELYYAMELIHRMLKLRTRGRSFLSVEERIRILEPIRNFIIACDGSLTPDADRTAAFWRRASDSFALSLAAEKMARYHSKYVGGEDDPFSLEVGYDEYQVPITLYPVFDLLFPGFRGVLGDVANLPIDEVNKLTYQYLNVVMNEHGVVAEQSAECVKDLFRLQVFAQFTRSITVNEDFENLRIDNINKYLMVVLLSCYFADSVMCVSEQDQQEFESRYSDVGSFFSGNRWNGKGEVIGLNVPEGVTYMKETELPRFGQDLDVQFLVRMFERLKSEQITSRYKDAQNVRTIDVDNGEAIAILSDLAWERLLTDSDVIGMLKLVLEEDEEK